MEAPQGAIQGDHFWRSITAAIIAMIAIICSVIDVPLLWSVKELKPVPSPLACPVYWLNYEGKCYFFSEDERNWSSSQDFCALYNSSLVVIENETEKVFLLRYMGTTGHWIGLQKDPHQYWKWTDGTEFNNLLEVKGESGNCAFLSTGFAMSSVCQIARKWICSQPDTYTRHKETLKSQRP